MSNLDNKIKDVAGGQITYGKIRAWMLQKGRTADEDVSTITLPVPYNNSQYSIAAIWMAGSQNTSDLYAENITTTNFKLTSYVKKAVAKLWIAYGFYGDS